MRKQDDQRERTSATALKAGGHGRERIAAAEQRWRERIAEQAASGLTVRDFCRREQLPESAFYFWRREVARRAAERKAKLPARRKRRTGAKVGVLSPPRFLPVTSEAFGFAGIEIMLADGRRVRVTGGCDVETLRQVLAVLENRPC